MATLVVQHAPLRQSRTPSPSRLTLDASKFNPKPILNKHIPYCSPGPAPALRAQSLVTPPASPAAKHASIQTTSLLYPPDNFATVSDHPPVYTIDAPTLTRSLNHIATQPLPDPKLVFPWLHGLHQDNQIQLAFFIARRKALRKIPNCIRGITIVKYGGNLHQAKLKGAIKAEEILAPTKDPTFFIVDPREGFSVRNFHIQAAKMAMVSDIVVYGEDGAKMQEMHDLAKKIARAQKTYRDKSAVAGLDPPVFNTFVVSNRFSDFERDYPEFVAIDSHQQFTNKVMDFFQWERQEMCNMSKASEIGNNVWLGPTPDPTICSTLTDDGSGKEFDIFIEASDVARAPDFKTLGIAAERSLSNPAYIEFPSSGSIMPPTWSHTEIDSLMQMCHWIYKMANPELTPESSEDGEPEAEIDSDGDIQMTSIFPSSRRILIHCADGYTESTLLAMTYFMFAEGISVHEAWVRLHCEKKRNFFAYQSDVALLTSIQPRIIQESPRGQGGIPSSVPEDPVWLEKMDGSLPSRILPYMYLGNLGHANNPDLLEALGISRVLSVGEPISWQAGKLEKWGAQNLLFVDRVQDNGVDPLTDEFERCLEFIEKGKRDGTATLVHCRVGVSRSATICIAEVMSSMGLSFPRAYCFVRARRLNVIIQPHLRFAYELLKWEEKQSEKRGLPLRRELEWASIAREVAAMNRPYVR